VLSNAGGYTPGTLIGAAYGADFIVARTELMADEVTWEEDNWVAAAEWADGLGADIISTSLGYFDWYEYSDLDGNTAVITLAADLAVSRGIAVFCSAGNERNKQFYYITPPADGDSVMAVGAVDRNGNLTAFSSAGPTYDGRIKPDIVALGSGVYSAVELGGYTYRSGTSFAAPLAAGAGALLLEMYPDWSPLDLRQVLIGSADKYEIPDNFYGYGLPDIFKASRLFYINPVEPIVLAVGDSINIDFTVVGLPDSMPVFTAYNLPESAVFADNGNRSATLRYTGRYEDYGTGYFQIGAAIGAAEYILEVSLTVLPQDKIAIGPNPFSDSLTIFIGPSDGRLADISIHTANGEKVWDSFTDNYNMTTSSVVWNGRNNDGAEVASGIYFVVVKTERTTKKFKIFKK
jgi:subtilisin family serine protease